MRKGSVNLFQETTVLFYVLIITAVFVMLNVGVFIAQNHYVTKDISESYLITVELNKVPELTRETAQLRGTTLLPNLILSAEYSNRKNVREKLQENLFCNAHYPINMPWTCTFDQGKFESIVTDRVHGKYKLNVGYKGASKSASNVATLPTGEGPSEHTLLLPAPGGQRMKFRLLHSGKPTILRWSD